MFGSVAPEVNNMPDGNEWLAAVAKKMQDDRSNGLVPTPERLTVSELLAKYGFMRRGDWVNSRIRNDLEATGLRTVPDFASTWLGQAVSVEPIPQDTDGALDKERPDPTLRVGALDAAHNKPMTVKPDQPLIAATTVMQLHDFSQMPVMTNPRDLRGIVSWKSIGARMVLGCECEFVRNCMEPAQEIDKETPLFDAIGAITKHGYVLVRDKAGGNVISGIVTASDLSNQFQNLAGPFLLAGEIEGHLRNLVHGKFTADQLSAVSAGGPDSKEINSASDLTLGEYCRLLEKPEHWDLLELQIDRKEFVDHLDKVRNIRNDIMHFKPEGLNASEIRLLQDVAKFFEELASIGVL